VVDPHATRVIHVRSTGLAGFGKSTFAVALAAKTGLPVIHLDLHFWKPGWVARRRPNGARRNVACSAATPGSPTATTTRHSISGSNARTLLCFSTCPGGCAHDARSCAASECRASCPKGATIRPGSGCAMSGVWPFASGGRTAYNRSANTRSFRSTGSMWPFTCSDPSGRSANSSTVWTPASPIERPHSDLPRPMDEETRPTNRVRSCHHVGGVLHVDASTSRPRPGRGRPRNDAIKRGPMTRV
jgi:hypothetical protein